MDGNECSNGNPSSVFPGKGQPKEFDPKFSGPIQDRGCTDVLCLLLLAAFIVGWGAIAVIAFQQGDPSILSYPVDSLGQKCGFDEPVKNKSYLYFFDITQCAKAKVLLYGCRTPQICVEKCPDFGPWSVNIAKSARESDESIKAKLGPFCKYGADMTLPVDRLVNKKMCPSYILPAKTRNLTEIKWKSPLKNVKSILARRCIPSTSGIDVLSKADGLNPGQIEKGIRQLLEFLNAKENFERLFEDLKNSWVIILFCLAIGGMASLIWICLMRCIASIMVWLSLFGMMVVLSYGCYFSVVKYIELGRANETEALRVTWDSQEHRLMTQEEFESHLDTYLQLQSTWLAFSIISGVLLAILLLIVLVVRSRLAIAVALIRQGAKAVGDMTFTLGWPLVPWIGQLVVIFWFVVVGFYLATATENVYRIRENCTCSDTSYFENDRCYPGSFNKSCGPGSECGDMNACQFIQHEKLSHVGWFHLYNFFGLLWLMCFISDFGDMVLAGAFSGWYWTFNRAKNLTMFPVGSSLLRTLRYHIGTVAFGSLIISTIKFIRFFLEYIDYKVRQYQDNPIAKGIMCCMRCCFWCLEKFMKFINRNAYIMTAVYGKNFCTSARDSFFLLMRNALRAFVLDKVTDFLLFMGKLVIAGGVAIGSFYLFSSGTGIPQVDNRVPELHFYLFPVIVITVGTYFIASLFFSVYNMAVDTLFLCFLEDCERNDGSPEKPYYMPKDLMEILGKVNRRPAPAGETNGK